MLNCLSIFHSFEKKIFFKLWSDQQLEDDGNTKHKGISAKSGGCGGIINQYRTTTSLTVMLDQVVRISRMHADVRSYI